MLEMMQYEFVRNATWAAVLSSVGCGIIGVYIVIKRLVSLSGGIAHAAFGGIGLGYFLGINPIITAIPFSLAAALGIGVVSKKSKIPEDTTIGIFWSLGMAFGLVMIGLTPGYAPDLFGYLFGNILMVTKLDIILMCVLDAAIVVTVMSTYNQLLAFSFDEEFARADGVEVNFLYYILLCLVALTVVLLIRIVGIILVIALMTLPAAIAKQYTFHLKFMFILSIIIGMVFTLIGLWISFQFDLASGATIILTLGAAFIGSSLLKMTIKAKTSKA